MTRLSFIRSPFTKLVILLVIVFAAMEVLTACSRTIHCPAFSNAQFDTWFPYQQGQLLLFMNSRSEKDSTFLYSCTRSGASVIKTRAYEPACRAEAQIHGQGSMPMAIYCEVYNDTSFVTVSVADFGTLGKSIGDTGLVLPEGAVAAGYKSAYYNSIHLNGKTFSSVQLLERNTARIATEGVYRVYISKENGIIAYEIYPSHDLWVKQ
jgi:hypothetical protein